MSQEAGIWKGEKKKQEYISLKRKIIFSTITGIIVAFCYIAGYQLDTFDSLQFADKHFYLILAIASITGGVIIYFIWQGLEWISDRLGKNQLAKPARRMNLLYIVFFILCWLPALFSIFPGVFSYDAYDEWTQVHEWMLTSHHPVAHVLFLGGLIEVFFRITGSYNVGIAVYSSLQMLALASAFAITVDFMREFGIPRIYRVVTVIFYAFSPVAQLFSICATKDVLFTAAELVFLLYVIRLAVDRNLMGNTKKMVRFGLSALCTMIFRNNGVYIVILTLFVLAIVFRRKLSKYKRNIITFLLVVFVPYFLYIGPIYKLLDVTNGGVEEKLSVPLQQMARVYKYNYDTLDEETLDLLYRYVERDALEQYRPTVSDFVKQGFIRQEFENDIYSFIKLWVKMGTEHPLTYINSFLINTVDAWYPHALIDGYRHSDGRGSWFDYRVAPPGEEKVYLQSLHDFYEMLSHDLQVQKKPFAFLLLSPGWYFLCALVLFFYFWSRRKYMLMIPMLVFGFHILTILLGPMILVRYMLLFFYAFPILLAMAIFSNNFEAASASI